MDEWIMCTGIAWLCCNFTSMFLCIPVLLFLLFVSAFLWCVPKLCLSVFSRVFVQIVVLLIACGGFWMVWTPDTERAQVCQDTFYATIRNVDSNA